MKSKYAKEIKNMSKNIKNEKSKKIDDKTMDNLEILSKLSLSANERDKTMTELEKILSYVDKLSELDTSNVEPLIHILQKENVFRDDEVVNGDGVEATLVNAPKKKDNYIVVPKTV